MLFLSPVTLPAAYMLAAATFCPAAAPPQVEMSFNNTAPIERTDRSSRELGSFNISTTFSHSRNEIFTIGGITVSDFSPEYLVDFNVLAESATQLACLSVKSVKINVKYEPTIYIASEFRPGSCRFQQTLRHETRHVNTDIITFNELLPQLKAAVQEAANRLTVQGPMKQEHLIPARDKLVDAIKAALVAKVGEIEQIRFNRQQAIDTRQQYLLESSLCPGEQVPRP